MKASFVGTITQAGTVDGITQVTIETEIEELKQMPMNLYGKTVIITVLGIDGDEK